MNNKQLLQREKEIRLAAADFPGLEIGEAYRRWKKARGEEATALTTSMHYQRKAFLEKYAIRPCSKDGCTGRQILEQLCGSSVEAKAGMSSAWTCEKCLFRQVYPQDYSSWFPNE
jgi:hypothetical protein